ncbi:MAG TPA: GreA/GreB family elongation factor [Kofleriaceae bacterium]|nr:GreA/GreB family elongation factor [Kofleriaceae bacterium]
MSKAFTKDDVSGTPFVVPSRAPLPPGVTNYVTPRGMEALRQELRELEAKRARLTGADGDVHGELAMINARIAEVYDRVATAVVVDPTAQPQDEARLGAIVRVRAENGDERIFQIVGVDEADVEHGYIAFIAPLARALLGKQVGDLATVRTPRGEEDLEIISIEYPQA